MEVIEVIEKEIEVIEVIERGPQGPQGAGITTLTTQGDLLYRGATTGERLPIGTTGQILKVSSGGIPEWGAAPSSGVSSVSGTSPIVSSGGSTPAISITAATTSAAGSMSAADKTKLDGIASGAEVNVNADWNASSGDAQILNKPTIPSTAADVGAVPTSRTISSGTGLTGGGDLSANRTLAVSYGTTAGTACEGNDGRIAGIESGAISAEGVSITAASAGFQVITGNGTGQIDTSDGGSIDTSNGGGSINTRGTGSIEFGEVGTRTTLTGTATANRAISMPNATGTLALTSDITKTAVGLGNVPNVDTTNAANISSGVLPNARVNWAAPSAIGSTTAAAITGTTGAFTTLSANNGTLTASAPVLDLSQTWNNAAVAFTGLKFNVTATAAASNSIFSDIQAGGYSQFAIARISSTSNACWIYNTNSGTNTNGVGANYERAKIAWSSNVLLIGTEKLGTGSARAMEFQTDGTSRLTISAGGSVTAAGTLIGGPIQSNSHVRVAAVSQLEFGSGGSRISNQSSGVLTLHDSALSDFGRLQFGGTTSSFPALKRSSTTLQVRLADDSADAPLSASTGTFSGSVACAGLTSTGAAINTNNAIVLSSNATMSAQALSATLDLTSNAAGLRLYGLGNTGGSSTNTERLHIATRSGNSYFISTQATGTGTVRALELRTNDVARLTIEAAGGLTVADANNIALGTTTGTKIGTATTQKIGFFNATPVVQQAAIADATDAATTQARLNDLLAAMRSLGLIAT